MTGCRQWLLCICVLLLAAVPAAAQEETAITALGQGQEQSVVIAVGAEGIWGWMHPFGDDLQETLLVYDLDPRSGLFNMNVVTEVLFSLSRQIEAGVHLSYNGFLDVGSEASLTCQEIGGVGRLLVGKTRGAEYSEVGFRVEAGLMRANFEVNRVSDVHLTGFVRPALSLGGGRGNVGYEFTFGWTFAQVSDGLGPGTVLTLGGMDVGFLIRVSP